MTSAQTIWAFIVANPATTAAFLSAIAALLSAIATWLGPRSAAKLAETIRRKSEWENDRKRMKVHVFATLMQERATMINHEAVRMLNSIDFVFHDNPDVRRRWASLFETYDPQLVNDTDEHRKRLPALLSAIATDVGMTDDLGDEDFHRVYYPNALAREAELRQLEQEQALRRMRPVEETQPNLFAKFPPKPS